MLCAVSLSTVAGSLLAVWLSAELLLRGAEACVETARSTGTADPADLIRSVTLSPSESASCSCCGLCYQDPSCSSLNFNAGTGECRLFSSVASYATLTPDSDWRYFVRPGRSQHHQFCRYDSDCQVSGDFCRGRVCTDLTAVTCRVIHDTFGAGDKFGDYIPGVHGWLDGRPVPLACKMGPNYQGFTRLLRSPRNFQFDRQTILEHNIEQLPDVDPHSMLSMAEFVRLAGTDPTYAIKVYTFWGYYYTHITFEIPRDEPVLSDAARPTVGTSSVSSNWVNVDWGLTMPYLPASGPSLFTVNADDADAYDGAVAREDGSIYWDGGIIGKLYVYMRE